MKPKLCRFCDYYCIYCGNCYKHHEYHDFNDTCEDFVPENCGEEPGEESEVSE